MITVLPLNLSIASAVTERLRDIDAVEIFGLRHDAPDAAGRAALAREASYCAAIGCGWGVLHDGEPAAVVGAHETSPGVWNAWAFGTDAWLTVARSVTLVSLRRLRPFLIERGCRIAEALSHEGHVTAHAWLERYGCRVEAAHVGYGPDGATYMRFCWRPAGWLSDVLRRRIDPNASPPLLGHPPKATPPTRP